MNASIWVGHNGHVSDELAVFLFAPFGQGYGTNRARIMRMTMD